MSRARRHSQKRPQAVTQHAPLQGTVEEKVNPAFASIVMVGPQGDVPQPHMMPKNYKAYAQEGYRGNDTLFKCINYIITNGAAIPPKLYTDDTRQTEIKSHPLLDKLKRPNPEQTGVQLRKAVLGYYLVAGNSYLYAIRKAPVGPPDELWTMQPDKVEINPTKTRGIVSYSYADFEGNADHPAAGGNPIPAANMCHMKTWDPNDPLFGISPIEVGAITVDQQTANKKWNLSLTQQGGKMTGAFTTSVMLSPNDRSKLEDKINEKYAGPRNAGRIAVLDGGLTWQNMGIPPGEMEWLGSLKYNAGSLANLYNMPPQLIGDTSSTTYDNMQEAKAASYTEEIFPVLDDMYAGWTNWLVPMYADLCDASGNPTAYLYYDKESVEVVQVVIQAQKDAKAKRAFQAWAAGSVSSCTLNEAREMQGLPPDPQGDVYRFGQVIVPRGELDTYAEQSLQKPAAPPVPVPEPMLNQPLPGSEPPPAPDVLENGAKARLLYVHRVRLDGKALDLKTDAEKKAYHDQVEAQRHTWETEIISRLRDYFKAEQRAVVQALRRSTATATDENHLLDLAKSVIAAKKSQLQHVITNAWRDVAEDFAQSTKAAFTDAAADAAADTTKATFPREQKDLEFFSSEIIAYLLQQSENKAMGLDQTTINAIRIALINGVEAGDSLPQLADRISGLYDDSIIPFRAEVIAATEVCAASNWGSLQYAQQSGLTLTKTWQATNDRHTRPWHTAADGQTVSMDEAFDVAGEQMQYPGDANGSEKNVANCRCTMYYQRVLDTSSSSSSENGGGDTGGDQEEEKRSRRLEYKRFVREVVLA